MQHDEHRQAFQAQTKALGGKEQNEPEPEVRGGRRRRRSRC